MVIWQSLNMACSEHCMFWAVCILGYFGFLRSAEFTVPNLASFLALLQLTVQDIAVDGVSAPYCMRVRIYRLSEFIGYLIPQYEQNDCTVLFTRHQSTKVCRAFSISRYPNLKLRAVAKNVQDVLRKWTPREKYVKYQNFLTHVGLLLSL